MSGWHDKEARNQALFRDVNERIEHLAEGAADGYDHLICECGNPECTKPIKLKRAEYERVRSYASRFVVALNHENPETESIVEQHERFAVVETYAGASSRIARETDPRSQRHLRTGGSRRDRRAFMRRGRPLDRMASPVPASPPAAASNVHPRSENLAMERLLVEVPDAAAKRADV